ncbi:MAG: DUF128 domain-containing protein [Methanomicrobiales archaeon]|jgi:repressor of nif and glnA expression|nr:DUF128 domain-containing protein [Methanomicrobiales archaeon]
MTAKTLSFVDHRIEELAIRVTYDPISHSGLVITNLSYVPDAHLDQALSTFQMACDAHVTPSRLIRVVSPHDPHKPEIYAPDHTSLPYEIPQNHTAVLTLCSVTVVGLLIRNKILVRPIGGGVVEIADNVPRRFTHMIRYDATTIDPLLVLISQETTSIHEIIKTGSGNLLASVHACHMNAETEAGRILDLIPRSWYTGILEFGLPNMPILRMPIDSRYFGIAALGGTNWIAALAEQNIRISSIAMKGLVDISEFDII